MEITETRIVAIEQQLVNISTQLGKIETGIFGDPKLGFPGVIETLRAQDIYIKTLESRLDALEQKIQDNALKDAAREQLVDKVEMWGKRVFWIVGALVAIAFAMTGKIGLLELFKLL